MADTVSKEVRSRMMARVRVRGTEPELSLRRALRGKGVRYQSNFRVAGYQVDIAIPHRKIAIFVDGCFWHGCPRCFSPPKSNKKYWGPKIAANKRRDKRIDRALRKAGWSIRHVWEHNVQRNKKIPRAIF